MGPAFGNADGGEQVTVLRGHTDAVLDAKFSPDGKFIATTSFDGTARIYPQDAFAPFDKIQSTALAMRELVEKNLTSDERALYEQRSSSSPKSQDEVPPSGR
jgi:WD40 repeat protein